MYANRSQERFKKNIARAPNGHRIGVIKGDSMLSLASLVAGGATKSFDMIYVDGSHEVRFILLGKESFICCSGGIFETLFSGGGGGVV